MTTLILAALAESTDARHQWAALERARALGEDAMIRQLARNPSLAGRAREEIFAARDATLLRAVLARDDLTPAEIAKIARSERRGELLALLVASPACDDGVLIELSCRRKVPVALAILTRPSAPEEAVANAVSVAAGHLPGPVGYLAALHTRPALHDRVARTVDDAELLRHAHLASSEELSPAGESRLIELLVEQPLARAHDPGAARDLVGALRHLARRKTLTKTGRQRLVAAALRLRGASWTAPSARACAAVGACRSLGVLATLEGSELADEVAFASAAEETERSLALLANPRLSGRDRYTLALGVPARRVVEAFPDDPWCRIAAVFRLREDRWAGAADTAALMAAMLSCLDELDEQVATRTAALLLGEAHIRPSVFAKLPVATVLRSSVPERQLQLADAVLAAGGAASLEVFWEIAESFTGTVEQLVASCTALAVGSG